MLCEYVAGISRESGLVKSFLEYFVVY
ncbi:hypothetical protein CBM2599_B50297 [Cupriavidus taiwanensis]|nr:hypothetical protein CBM2599_B50297 [Cupriavidus taiwanensis]